MPLQTITTSSGAQVPCLLATLPFEGFYGSWLSEEHDRTEERLGEHIAEGDCLVFEDLLQGKTLEVSDVCEAMYWASNYSAAFQIIAKAVVSVFAERVQREYGLALDLVFESMRSPRDYAFSTDVLYVYIPLEQAKTLLEKVRSTTLKATIQERFTSCSGFISFYSNDIEEWLAKPLEEWDHNEVGTLLNALIAEDAGWDEAIVDRLVEHNVFDEAVDASIDWEDLRQRLQGLLCEPA